MVMRNFFSGVLYVVTGLALLIRCSNDPEPVEESFFNNGVFIVNEGNFTDSDGSLSYYDFDSARVENNVFETINDRPLAAIFQSLTFYNKRGYIIDSNGRIEIVNESDMTSIGTINSGLALPRYFTGSSNYGYVSDWGPYDDNWGNPDSKIIVFDLETMQMVKILDTPSRPEAIIEIDGYIYVANSATNLITIYDSESNSLQDSIEVNNGPTQFVLDRNGDLWLVSTGAYISGGALEKIDLESGEVIKTIDIGSLFPNGRLAINGDRDLLFFMGEKWADDFSYTETNIFKTSIDQPESYSEIIAERNLYGLGVDPVNDEIYITDAVYFQGNGKVYTYDFSGNKLDEYSVGRGPRDFVFRN